MKNRNLHRSRPSLRSRRGFTLIELLVVILILSILAALIVPRLVSRTSDAKKASASSDISTLSSLLQQYRLDNDGFPTTEEGLQALVTKPSSARNWKGPYTTKALPTDPWGNEYIYQAPGPDGQDFLITSYGADGQPGGDGDAADITSDQ
ncbi:type II secretion system major pseudopilin GspG [Capsulimonas corticalis]|uniref:type II secretion system major pseudopilin GspG n=1 Tax=Capsulimonas corticalis TaxID=2219043 RepID=UPI000E653F9A|nr:type II secretion system major pseudopilin GspG [Capsulimonas corticalis]